MKAAIADRYGSADVLRIADVDRPVPKANEVLVRVRNTTVNRTDEGILSGRYLLMRFFTGLFRPKSPILGTDFAGTVEQVGASVTTFRIGDEVFGLNDEGLRSHAEYLAIGEDKSLAIMPAGVDHAHAVASLEGAHYAYNIIRSVGEVKGRQVLVNGGTGAIGSAAVQLLTHFGADVTAVCGTEHLGTLRSLGARHVIDFHKEDFTTRGERFHFVLDTVGKSTFGKCKAVLLPKGVYVSTELGPHWQNVWFALFSFLFFNKKVKFPIPRGCRMSVLFMKDLIEQGQFRPLIERTFPLDMIADAYRHVASGQKIGNVVIAVG